MGELTLIGSIPRDTYNPELAMQICHRIANGEHLKHICQEDGMPGRMTVYDWKDRHPEFARALARAREAQADLEVDEAKEIADNLQIPHDHKRHMINARFWRAERLNTRSYGAKVKHEVQVEQDAGLEPDALPGGLAFLGQHKSEGETE